MSAIRAADADTLAVEIKVEGLRSAKGNVLVCLTANPKAFPDCSKDISATRAKVPVGQAKAMHFDVPRSGQYAIAVIHDENANGKLDTRFMMPREGFGFSRNPSISFGPPKFVSAQFAVGAAGATQSVKMKYML